MATLGRRRFLAEVSGAAALGGFAHLEARSWDQPNPDAPVDKQTFQWPDGKRAGISLNFDDARVSQIDVGLDLLDECGVKVTFCVVPKAMKQRLEGWRRAVASGHEIGNHTANHPCTVNYGFSTQNVLENFTMDMMAKDIDGANAEIQHLLGVTPITFAYPCGEMFVGRGRGTASYIPLVAERFVVGLGPTEDWTTDRYEPVLNNPALCDLARVHETSFGEWITMDFEDLVKRVSKAIEGGRWLVFGGHEFGDQGRHVANDSVIRALCRYITDPSRGIWVDTVGRIGKYIQEQRAKTGMSAMSRGAGRLDVVPITG
jgi:peptidoglycan/xylan/chitin deacetylase (PgdA/CDA1 family)